jgi:Flp pilus assembly protein TadG
MLKRFWQSREGNFALAAAIAMVPVIGSVGMAIDYSRATNARSFAQAQADAAALVAAQVGPDGNIKPHMDRLRETLQERYQLDSLNVEGTWISPTDLRVEVTAGVPTTFLKAVPVFPSDVLVAAATTVRIAEPSYVYTPPTVSELDYEAGDYNRIYVYCFDPDKVTGQGKNKSNFKDARSEPIPIADNGGTNYKFEMPRCEGESRLSYKLLNVRLARTQPHLWDDPAATRFEFYSDAVLDEKGAEVYDIKCYGKHCNQTPAQGWNILETVLCDTEATMQATEPGRDNSRRQGP